MITVEPPFGWDEEGGKELSIYYIVVWEARRGATGAVPVDSPSVRLAGGGVKRFLRMS